MRVKELQIPLPWGHVAAKTWGNEKNVPVLMIHAMSDNAGSFDKLIPYLPRTFYYICVDLPGHGRSSHFPPYLCIHMLDFIFTCKLMVDYLNREKYIIVGHSWGGRMAIVFTQLYPESVLKLILLDPVYTHFVVDFKQYIIDQFDQLQEINNKQLQGVQQSYTYNKISKRIKNGVYGRDLDKESVEAFLKRSVIPINNGRFYLTHDPRLKMFPTNLMQSKKLANDLVKAFPITCPVLVILGIGIPETIASSRHMSIILEIKKHNAKCIIKEVEGDHYVHMKQPEIVGVLISTFLNLQAKL